MLIIEFQTYHNIELIWINPLQVEVRDETPSPWLVCWHQSKGHFPDAKDNLPNDKPNEWKKGKN